MTDDKRRHYLTKVHDYLTTARGQDVVLIAKWAHPDNYEAQAVAIVQAATGLRRYELVKAVADALTNFSIEKEERNERIH